MKRLALCFLIPALIFAAARDRNWKTGKVTADSSINSPSEAVAPHHVTNDLHILIIQGDDHIYTVEEKHAWNGWCLLIQGEEIKYSPDSRKLYVIDADGYKCRLDILKQAQRLSP